MTADEFDFIDLFAGIGGFHVALRGLGGRCVLAVDNDRNCESVYLRNFRGTPFLREITELTTPAGLRKIPPHDVLCAGFPCQPFSKSGSQLGLRDRTRGTLFFHIMEVVRARRPRFVILENVRNLAGPRHRETWEVIIRSLRGEGYRLSDDPVVFSPHLLRRSQGGRPQVRERVYILAERQPSGTKLMDLQFAPLIANRPVGNWRPSEWNIVDFLDDDADIDLARYQLRPEELRWLEAWQVFIQRLDEDVPGFPIWVDAFQDRPDLSPRNPAWKNAFLLKNSQLYVRNKSMISEWRTEYGIRDFPDSRKKFEWQARGHDRDLWKLLIHLRPSGIRVKPPTYVPALVAITQTSIVGARRRRLTSHEAARLQGFDPTKFVLHENESVAYRQLGNAVNVGVTRYLARALFDSSDLGWPGRVRESKIRRRARRKPVQLRFLESA